MATGGYSDDERGHDETFYKILDKSQFKSGASVVVQEVPTETCQYHRHKPVDIFCEKHDKVGCSTCMATDHSKCRKKFYILDYIKNKPAGNPADISAHLDTLKNSIHKLQKTLNEDDRNLRTSKDDLINQIRKVRKEINQKLDDLEKNTMKRADTTFQPLADGVQSKMKKLQELMAEIHSTQDRLQAVAGNQTQLFVSMKQARDVVSATTEIVKKTLSARPFPTSFFKADLKLKSLLQKMENLGSNNFREVPYDKARSQGVPATDQQLVKTTQHVSKQEAEADLHKTGTKQMPSLLKIKRKKKYHVKLSSDKKRCSIYSACILDDGTVILADYHDVKLKRLDRSTYRVRDSCDVPRCPWQVCVFSQQEVAVSCFYSRLIQFVSVGSTMCCTRQIHTYFYCHGLACADGKLYVSDEYTSVYVYNVSGERLQQLSEDQSGQFLFSYIRSLAVSSDNFRIYVADSNKGLIILDKSGKLVSRYNGPQLDEATGVCLYKNDSVLVHGCHSKNVLQFTAEGQLVGQVLKTERSSLALCFDENSSQLVVPRNEDIAIYDINT